MTKKAISLPFGGRLEKNMPPMGQKLLDLLFDDESEIDWSWSGMAYCFAQRFKQTDLEDFLWCLQKEIERRTSMDEEKATQ